MREAGIDFTLKDLQTMLRETPVLCSFAPRGKRTMKDLHDIGGTPVLLKHFLDCGLLDGSCLTVTGKTMSENLADVPAPPAGQDLIVSPDNCYKAYADVQICFGNLAPDGIVFKVSNLDEPVFEGIAMCFDDPREIVTSVEQGKIRPGTVVVLRYWGPVASGMPEVLVATSANWPFRNSTAKWLSSPIHECPVSLTGPLEFTLRPEAAVGGPIACVENGDSIRFDLLKGSVEVLIPDELMEQA